MAAVLAGVFAAPAGIYLKGKTGIPLAFTGAAMIFLPLFVFLPKIIRRAMLADTDAILNTFGKNEHVKKVFWAVFSAVAGIVLAQVLDPVTTQ
jgi:F0F1-type ATP synthase assembly protein I